MKRVLFVMPTMRIGGAEKALVSLLCSLDPERVTVDLFLFEHGGVLQKQIPRWVQILPEDVITRAMTLEFRTYWKDPLRKGKIGASFSRLIMSVAPTIRTKLRMRKKSSWDMVAKHIPMISKEYDVAIGYLEGFADFFTLEKVTAKRKIAWIHSDLSKHHLASKDIEKYNEFDSVVTITESCKNSFASVTKVSLNNIVVIENIVSREQVTRLSEEFIPNWSDDIPQLLTVGRLEYQKGSDIGLEACRQLKAMGIGFRWHFVGTGSLLVKLQKLAADYGLSNCCLFEGPKENPYPYMKRADIIVQPSRVEGKSIVLDEAKILGKAIVATNYPSVNDQIEDSVTGLIVDISPKEIAESIAYLLREEPHRKRIEQNNKNMVNETNDRKLEKFYKLIDIKQ